MGGKFLADVVVVRVVTSWEVDCLFRGNERTRNIHSTINASFFVSCGRSNVSSTDTDAASGCCSRIAFLHPLLSCQQIKSPFSYRLHFSGTS